MHLLLFVWRSAAGTSGAVSVTRRVVHLPPTLVSLIVTSIPYRLLRYPAKYARRPSVEPSTLVSHVTPCHVLSSRDVVESVKVNRAVLFSKHCSFVFNICRWFTFQISPVREFPEGLAPVQPFEVNVLARLVRCTPAQTCTRE